MIRVVEQFTAPKCATTPSEDAVVVTSAFAAIIDGATPKTAYRYPSGETPGHMAARLLGDAIAQLSSDATAAEATRFLTQALHQPSDIVPANRPTASCIVYSDARREVWMLGDCHLLALRDDGSSFYIDNPKSIDQILASWRRSVIVSALGRQLMTEEQVLADDPGRRIIQHFITRQVRYQNRADGHSLAYCMLDGQPVPEALIRIVPIPSDVSQLVLASDGYPVLHPTLAATEATLSQQLAADPLCIASLLGTKGLRPGSQSYDDRTYLRIQL